MRRVMQELMTTEPLSRVCMLIVLPLLLGSCTCKVKEQGVRPVVVHSKYFQVYALSTERDDVHRESINDPEGRTWYYDPVPGLDMGKCEFEEAIVMSSETEGSAVWIRVAEPYRDQVGQWFIVRIGAYAGMILAGDLVWVVPINSWTDRVAIGGFNSKEEAEKCRDIIRNGGAPSD